MKNVAIDINKQVIEIGKYITLELDSISRYFYFSLSTTNPNCTLKEPLNTMVPFTRLYKINYKPTQTLKQLGKTSVSIEDTLYDDVSIMQDTIIFNRQAISLEFTFYFFHAILSPWYEGFGFASKFEDDSLSIVHLLYNNKIISQKSFILSPHEGQTGKIHFGEAPSYLINDQAKNKNIGICNINTSFIPWNCFFDNVQLETGLSIPIQKDVFFNTNQYWMILSKHFYDVMVEYVFKDVIEREICRKLEESQRGRLNCKEEILQIKGEITFNFQGMGIIIPLKDLFECGNFFCESAFAANYREKDEFQIGAPFFRKFDLSIFDYDRQRIEFHSSNYTIVQRNNLKEKMIGSLGNGKFLLTICFICLLFGSILLLFINKNNRKIFT